MSRLGIDLGTSGCTVSYWDRNTRAPEFYCRGLTETARIPAVISYGIRETVIGEAARLEEGKSETCAGFFVRLGRARELPLPGTSVTAGKAAADYLNVLLRHVREKLGAVEQMTVAVPAAWLRPEADNPLSPILRTRRLPAPSAGPTGSIIPRNRDTGARCFWRTAGAEPWTSRSS